MFAAVTRRVRRQFRPALDSLPLRLAPSTLPALPTYEAIYTAPVKSSPNERLAPPTKEVSSTAPSYTC